LGSIQYVPHVVPRKLVLSNTVTFLAVNWLALKISFVHC
jgi:hypothetical protein